MKVLLDQNLSFRLLQPLSEVYSGSTQVSLLNMGDASDREIWDTTQREGYAIVTQDADFHEYSLLQEGAPLVIWLKCGNQPKSVFLDKLLVHQVDIEQAHEDPEI